MKQIIALSIFIMCAITAYAERETNSLSTLYPEVYDSQDIYLRKMLQGFKSGAFAGETVYYTITNALTATNFTSGAPFYGLLTLTNASDGTRCPEIVSCMPVNRDGFAFDFELQPFSSPPTNGTYTTGTAITDWGNDRLYLLPALTQTTITNTYGYSWRTNAGLAILDAQPLVHAVPITGTNMQFLIISKGSYTFTNGMTWLIGLKN